MTGPRQRRSDRMTAVGSIAPELEGPGRKLLAAARRWRRIAGDGLARRLPLLDVREDCWIIGLPSPAWEAELQRLVGKRFNRANPPLPRLVGHVMEKPRRPAVDREKAAQPDADAPAVVRLEWLMGQMLKRQGE